jgi:protein-tyrosine phosphatase
VLELCLSGRSCRIFAGPFAALPDGAIGLCLDGRNLRAADATLLHPIPDFGVPEDPAAFRAALQRFAELLAASPDLTGYVGCHAGLGRTGLALACLARMAGIPGDPVAWVRAAYDHRAVETPAQEDFVRRFSA